MTTWLWSPFPFSFFLFSKNIKKYEKYEVKYAIHHKKKTLKSESAYFFPQHSLWVSLTVRASVFVPPGWFAPFRTPHIRHRYYRCYGPLPLTDLIVASSP